MLLFLALAGATSLSIATPVCENVKLKNADRTKIQAVFAKRYCSKVADTRCERRWKNFNELLDRVVADDRTQHIPLASFLSATAYVETFNRDFSASTSEVKGKVNEDRPYWREDSKTKMQYFGRGWLQLTWKDKYERAARELKIDLVNNPDLALNPDVAFQVLLLGLTQGWIETYRSTSGGGAGSIPISVNDFLLSKPPNYAGARAAINANCIGNCSKVDRVKVANKGFIPVPAKIDAALKTEAEAKFFESALCAASAP